MWRNTLKHPHCYVFVFQTALTVCVCVYVTDRCVCVCVLGMGIRLNCLNRSSGEMTIYFRLIFICQVLTKLAEVLEGRRRESRGCLPQTEHHINFVREGGERRSTRPKATPKLFSSDQEWNMRVDLGRQLQFPSEITTTSLRPDIVVWSTKAKTALLIELT